MKIIIWATFTLALGVLLTTCAGSTAGGAGNLRTESSSTWVVRDPAFKGGGFQNILVIGIFKDHWLKRAVENAFVTALEAGEPLAVAAHRVLPVGEQITRELVIEHIEGTGIDAVLVIRLLAVGTEMGPEPERDRRDAPAPTWTDYTGPRDFYGHYASVYTTVHDPGYAVPQQTVEVQTNLFDAATATLVWTAKRKTANPKGRGEIIRSLADATVKQLVEGGLI